MKQNKKYALRKTVAYGLMGCAVGFMLVGSAPTYAEEGDSVNATSIAEDTQDTSRITDVLNGQVQGVIQTSKPLTGNDFIVDADVAPDKLPAIEHYKTIFNQIPASYRRLVTSVQFIHAEDAILGSTSSSRGLKIRANYIHPDQTPDFSDGLATMFHELGHVIDFASIQGSGDSLWSLSRDPYMYDLLTSAYPNDQRAIYEIFASVFGSWLNYRTLGAVEGNMQNLYNQFDSLFGGVIFNSPYNDECSQTEKPDTTYSETQTKAEVKVIYQFTDGRVYKSFNVNADKGAILDRSDLVILPDDMDFDDDFVTYEVKGENDVIVRIVKKHVSDEGTQTEKPDVKDDDTDKPVTNDQGTQTDKPSDELDGNNDSTQTKPDNKSVVEDVTIKVVYVDENGQTIQSVEVIKQVGSTIGLKDMQDLDDSYVFTNFDKDVKDFVVGKDATLTVHAKKTQQVDNGIEPSDLIPQKDWVKADVKTDKVKKVSVGTNQLPKALAIEAKLPKAGSEDSTKIGIIGATMALLGGMIGFVSRRKVHK